MSKYIELPVDQIELDKSNPRIANFLATHDEDDITSELMALLLGTTSDACASLRQSIEANYGIIHPIIVNKRANGTYVVIEGNTRLQIYKDLRRENKPGNWDTIRSIVYEDIDDEEMHKIRLQAHLVGPREWDPYSKAKYLDYLANEEHMPIVVRSDVSGGIFLLCRFQKSGFIQCFQILIAFILRKAGKLRQLADAIMSGGHSVKQDIVGFRGSEVPAQL